MLSELETTKNDNSIQTVCCKAALGFFTYWHIFSSHFIYCACKYKHKESTWTQPPKSSLQLSLTVHDPTNHPQCNAKMTPHPPTQNASMNVIPWAPHDLQQEYGCKTLTIGICMLLNHKDNMLFHMITLQISQHPGKNSINATWMNLAEWSIFVLTTHNTLEISCCLCLA